MALEDQVQELFRANRRAADGQQFTVPSPELYPFQWLWDSCFHAIVLSHFDIDAAKKEIYSAICKPLPSGLIPHIIYWGDDTKKTNWGREMRGDILNMAWGTDGTSSITQPPLMACAAWAIYKKDGDEKFLESIYETLRRHYLYLLTERDPDKNGLIGIINPDESGEDNSPRFDTAQGLPPSHSDDENLDRRIDRIKENQRCRFDAATCMRGYFWIEDVPFNAILIKALGSLARIADVIGRKNDAKIFRAYAEATAEAVRTLLCKDGLCRSLDGIQSKHISVKTWALFAPLYAHILTKEEADALITNHLLNESEFWTPYPVPSTAADEESFHPQKGFWRGPVWMAPNWFIYKGLMNYGYDDIAKEIRQKSIALLTKSGFREQYNPLTGEGVGARDFTWGGLVLDMG